MQSSRTWLARVVMAVALMAMVGACSSADDESTDSTTTTADGSAGTGDTTTSTEATTTTTAAPPLITIEPPPTTTTTAPPVDPTAPPTIPAPTTAPSPPPGITYQLDWDSLRYPTWFELDDETNPDDPFFYIHTQSKEGFFFSLEMYTTGFGSAWTGDLGDFEIGCSSAGSGICLHFDPDGDDEALGDLNADFAATGKITITKLDEDGYDLTLTDIVFSNGDTIPGPTQLTGP